MPLTPGAIAGIVLGTLAAVLVLLVAACWLLFELATHRNYRFERQRQRAGLNYRWTYTEGVVWDQPELDRSFVVHGVRYVGPEVAVESTGGSGWESLRAGGEGEGRSGGQGGGIM